MSKQSNYCPRCKEETDRAVCSCGTRVRELTPEEAALVGIIPTPNFVAIGEAARVAVRGTPNDRINITTGGEGS